MNILLIEDEYPAAEWLQKLVQRVEPAAVIVGVVESVAQGVRVLAGSPAPDLILADIQLSDGLSFEIFEQTVVRTPIVFTTSYDAYALRAFKVHSLDYLLKPIKESELRVALDKFRELRATATAATTTARLLRLEHLLDDLERSPRPYKTRFLVRWREQLLPFQTTEIAYFFSAREQVWLMTFAGQPYALEYSLEQLEKLLDPAQFFRVNRQLLAQPAAITRIDLHFNGKLKLTLRPEQADEVLVSREKTGAFRKWLEGA